MFNKGYLQVFISMPILFLCVVCEERKNLYLEYESACQHEEIHLRCKPGEIIDLIPADLVTTSDTKCLDRKIDYANCVDAFGAAVNVCTNVQECRLKLKNKVFGSPCPTKDKYFVLVYQCINSAISVETFVTCQGDTLSITCTNGNLTIMDAFYGRKDRTTCTTGKAIYDNFDDQRAIDIMRKACNTKAHCSVKVSREIGFNSSPQPESDYLIVTARCFKGNYIFNGQIYLLIEASSGSDFKCIGKS